MVADPVVRVSLVSSDFFGIPGFVEVRAQQLSKSDNPEDDGSVDEENDEAEYDLFSPCHTDIRSFHPPNKSENKRGNPEGKCPNDTDPNATTCCQV